jgi:hypothetical protein
MSEDICHVRLKFNINQSCLFFITTDVAIEIIDRISSKCMLLPNTFGINRKHKRTLFGHMKACRMISMETWTQAVLSPHNAVVVRTYQVPTGLRLVLLTWSVWIHSTCLL